ncbi:hypothetical protein [Streptomyces sp. NPDC051286]
MTTSAEAGPLRSPVTADDLDRAVRLAVGTLRQASPEAWNGMAGSLEWH